MSLTRENYYAELHKRMAAVAGIKTSSRRLAMFSDVPPAKQPYICTTVGGQQPSYSPGRTVMWTLSADVYLYVQDPKNKEPGPILNEMLDKIGAAFAPDNQMVNACTFGGLTGLHKAEIANIETDEGTLGEQAVAVITVTMTVVGTPI